MCIDSHGCHGFFTKWANVEFRTLVPDPIASSQFDMHVNHILIPCI